MDHDDIVELIDEGKADEARALIAAREAKGGISSHDRQTLDALLAGQEVEEQPRQAEMRIAANETTGDLEVETPAERDTHSQSTAGSPRVPAKE